MQNYCKRTIVACFEKRFFHISKSEKLESTLTRACGEQDSFLVEVFQRFQNINLNSHYWRNSFMPLSD